MNNYVLENYVREQSSSEKILVNFSTDFLASVILELDLSIICNCLKITAYYGIGGYESIMEHSILRH